MREPDPRPWLDLTTTEMKEGVTRRPPRPIEGDESSSLAASEIGRHASPAWGTAPGLAEMRVLPPRDERTISAASQPFSNLDQGSSGGRRGAAPDCNAKPESVR